MIRSLATAAALLLSGLSLSAQTDSLSIAPRDTLTAAPRDSVNFAPLDSLLISFYEALEGEGADEKAQEADFLIGTCRDSLTRQHVAIAIFDHYRDSRLMGDDSVCIQVYDNWFASGIVSFEGELSAMDAEIFVKFNRENQLGCDAPQVTLFKPCGGRRTVPESGRATVLFFYDTHCSKCRIESKLLPEVLAGVDFKLDFVAVYAGTDKTSWAEFRRHFKVSNPKVRLIHLWDPELDSGYQLSYGVYGTPRMYLVEPGGTIIGKKLEVENLRQLLPVAGAIQAKYDEFYK